MSVKFTDNSIEVKAAIKESILQYLDEASGELAAKIQRKTPVDTGQLKSSWDYIIDEGKLKSTIGSPLENAIWTEFGTGEYALNGNGRKGGWKYEDEKGDWHFTHGKPPVRMMHKSFTALKPNLIKRAEQTIGGGMK